MIITKVLGFVSVQTSILILFLSQGCYTVEESQLRLTRSIKTLAQSDDEFPLSLTHIQQSESKSASSGSDSSKNRLASRGLLDGIIGGNAETDSSLNQNSAKPSGWFSGWSKPAPEKKPETQGWLGGLVSSKPSTDSAPKKEESSSGWRSWLGAPKTEEPAPAPAPKPQVTTRGWGWFGGKPEEKQPDPTPAPVSALKPEETKSGWGWFGGGAKEQKPDQATSPAEKSTVAARGWDGWFGGGKSEETEPEPDHTQPSDQEPHPDDLQPGQELDPDQYYDPDQDPDPNEQQGVDPEAKKESEPSSGGGGWFGGGSKGKEVEDNPDPKLKSKGPDSWSNWWDGSKDKETSPKEGDNPGGWGGWLGGKSSEKKDKKDHGPLRSLVKSVEHMIVPKPVRHTLKAIPGVQPTRRAYKSGLDAVDGAVDSVTNSDYIKNIREAGKLSGKRVALRAVNLADSLMDLSAGANEATLNMVDTLQKENGRTLDSVSVAVNSAKPAMEYIKSKSADGVSRLKEGNESLRQRGKRMLSAISSKVNLGEVAAEMGVPKVEEPSNKPGDTPPNGWFGW